MATKVTTSTSTTITHPDGSKTVEATEEIVVSEEI